MTSTAEITTQEWQIADGWQAGGINPKTLQSPIGSANNVQIIPGEGMALVDPGSYLRTAPLYYVQSSQFRPPAQSPDAASFTSAEVVFPDVALGGIW